MVPCFPHLVEKEARLIMTVHRRTAQNVPLEIGIGFAVGIAGGLALRSWFNNDIKSWAGK